MILLSPPYQVIDGYTVLSDHADQGLFYVLPSAPRLGHTQDGRPAISLVEYLGGGTGAQQIAGGLLSLTTELAVLDEVLSTLKERIVAKNTVPSGTIRLMPVLFESGTVELVALGESSAPPSGGTPGTPPAASSGPFKLRFLGSGKPSLDASNRASFQLLLDADAATLVEHSLDSPDLPLIAIYRMSLAGLRPSFQVDIQADWSKVYHSLKNKVNINIYYVAVDAESYITSALEENNIKIDTSVFGTSPSAQAAAERAQKYLTDWVLQHLFTPMVDPNGASANAIGTTVDDVVWSLARTVLPGVGYQLRMIDDTELRLMSAHMNEAVAELQEIVPQGTLGGFLHRYEVDAQGHANPNWPTIRKELVQKVNLDGFPRLEVTIAAEDRFSADGLAEIIVDMARVKSDGSLSDTRSFTLRSATDRANYVVNLLGQEPAIFSAPYQYRMEVHFDPSGPFGPHDPVNSDWQLAHTPQLFVEPRETVYSVREVTVSVAPIFSFSQFPAISVSLRYNADGNTSQQTGLIELTPDKPSQTWHFRSFAAQTQPYEYQVTYHRTAENGGDIEHPWQQQVENWLSVSDPLPVKRTLNLFVNLPWSDINVAFVQVRYQDDRNNIHFDEQIDLNASTRYIRRDYPIAADGPRTISYRLTLLLNRGPLLEGSWRETEDDRLVLDRRLVDSKAVTVRTVGGGFAENHIAEIDVILQVREPNTAQVRAQTTMKLTSDTNSQPVPPWEYLLGDPPVHTVYYNALFIDPNGFTQNIDWQSTDADLIIIQLRTKTISA